MWRLIILLRMDSLLRLWNKIKAFRSESDEKTKEPKHLTFYHSEEAEGPLLAITLSRLNGLNTSTKRNSSKMRPSNFPSFTWMMTVTLWPWAKFLRIQMEPNRSFCRNYEESSLSSVGWGKHWSNGYPLLRVGFGQWEFQYEKGNFTIPFPTKVKGDDTFTVPLSKFYDVIDTERLLPDDLASYESLYWRTPP